jgi:hypothetical protein
VTEFRQPVTFYIPQTAGEPIDIDVAHSGLRMVLVNREAIGRLGTEWRELGVYFLLGPSQDPERFAAYVGEVGRRDLLTRLVEHARQKEWWNRALLMRHVSPDGFNSAEIGWLEGRLYDVLNNAVAADLMNKGRPGDDSIALKNRGILEKYVEPVIAALRACGAPPDTADQKPVPMGKKRAYYGQSVKDLIDAGLLKAGTRLQPLRKQYSETALVLEDGTLRVGDQIYQAVSTAAVAVSGSKSEPGWEFWGAPSGGGDFVPLYRLRDRLIEGAASASPGHPAAPPPSVPAPSSTAPALAAPHRTARRPFDVSVKDLIDAGLLQPGDVLRTTRRGSPATAAAEADGRVVVGGTPYTSPSTAAVAASGNKSEPGWEYWAVERDGHAVPLYTLRQRLLDGRTGSTERNETPMWTSTGVESASRSGRRAIFRPCPRAWRLGCAGSGCRPSLGTRATVPTKSGQECSRSALRCAAL